MLRLKVVVSVFEDFMNGYFLLVIGDILVDVGAVDCVLLCLGKVYWDVFVECIVCGDDWMVIVWVE